MRKLVTTYSPEVTVLLAELDALRKQACKEFGVGTVATLTREQNQHFQDIHTARTRLLNSAIPQSYEVIS
jgi:hypothetical protein